MDTCFICILQLACVFWGIFTSSSFHVICILHALCYVFHLSSLSSLMGSFASSLSHIPFMSYFHCLDFNHSDLPISRGIFASPSFHFLCISYAICCMFCYSAFLCFSRASAHPPLFAFHAMHLMCLTPHQLPFIFSPTLEHPGVPIFSHSMHFMWLPTICTIIQQQLQPANLSIFPSCMFLCHSFSYQSAYLHSISYHLFFFISHFLCESFHWHSVISPHPLSPSTLSPHSLLSPQITLSHCPLSSFPLPLHLLGLRDLGQMEGSWMALWLMQSILTKNHSAMVAVIQYLLNQASINILWEMRLEASVYRSINQVSCFAHRCFAG